MYPNSHNMRWESPPLPSPQTYTFTLLGLPGVLNRRTVVRIRTQTQLNLDQSQNQQSNLIMIQASFHWCVISRYIFFSYSMWFLSSVSNPEVQSGAVITTSLWQLTHSMLAASSVGHAGCVCQWQQRGQIDLWTVSVYQQTKIMACSKPDKKRWFQKLRI